MKQHILITGSTDGIGKLVALKCAQEGHVVYVHGRNEDKLNNVVAELKQESSNESIIGFLADFSDLDSVHLMIAQIKQQVKHIDVLINNAGVLRSSITQTKNGLDIRFVVNYLAAVLLTNELMPFLQQGNSSRIINVSSAAQTTVSLDALRQDQGLLEMQVYAQSKLALTMWSFFLAQKYLDIVIVAVNPGSLLHTNMALEAFGKSWSSADKGAQIVFDLAFSQQYLLDSGKYFDNDKGIFAKAHVDVYDLKKVESLMHVTDEILGKGM